MSHIDIILLAIILLISFKGFFDGFIHELSTLIGIVAGIFFASRLASNVAVFFNTHIFNIQSPSISIILGFIIVLAFFWVGFLLIGFVITKFVRYSGLGILDRILGYCFSCLKVFCIFSFILFGINQIHFIKEIDFVKNLPLKSKVYHSMLETADTIIQFDSPQKIAEQIKKISPRIEEKLQDGTEQLKRKASSEIFMKNTQEK